MSTFCDVPEEHSQSDTSFSCSTIDTLLSPRATPMSRETSAGSASTLTSSSPPEPSITSDRLSQIVDAFEEAQKSYFDGFENGPYILKGEYSLAEFEQLDRFETKWRIGYNVELRQILLYGDPSPPHETTISAFRSLFLESFKRVLATLQTSSTSFNAADPDEKEEALLYSRGGSTTQLGNIAKQADECLRPFNCREGAGGLVLEVAYKNESREELLSEVIDWHVYGKAGLSIGIKVSSCVLPLGARLTSFID
jgi:hypothetical protein